MRMVCQVRGARQVPFPITHNPNRISGQWSRQLWRWGRFERPGGCSVIHQEQQVLSLCCFVDGLQLSEDHFHHLPNAHSAKTDDSTRVCSLRLFSHPENFLGHLTPSVAGSEWRCKISISKSSFYVQSGLWSTLVQFKFVLIFCKWGRSFWSKRILNHKWTACLVLVSVSLLGADSLYTSASECIYNWRGLLPNLLMIYPNIRFQSKDKLFLIILPQRTLHNITPTLIQKCS